MWTVDVQINRIHERSLRIVYNDTISSLEDILTISVSVRIDHRNIQMFAVEISKTLHNLSSLNEGTISNQKDKV